MSRAVFMSGENNPWYGEQVRWNGWGFRDTSLSLNEKGLVTVTGDHYPFSGEVMPKFRQWAEDAVGISMEDESPPQTWKQMEKKIGEPLKNEQFIAAIRGHYKIISFSKNERLLHGHGHTCQEVYALRWGAFPRLPDVVVYPGSHEHVEAIVKAAVEHDVVLIPYGGGTSVTGALLCPENESRMIVSVDMHEMGNIQWINRHNMTANVQAGAVGRELEAKLRTHGLTMGHEPDSSEFSTLGGWVATRASGMMKNVYGNIEDIVVRIRAVTPTGTVFQECQGPRVSLGPSVSNMIMGSEGTLGIVTEAVVKVRPIPEVTRFGSIVFHNFESGVRCLYEIQSKHLAPCSIRLMDNLQFVFGQALKGLPHSPLHVVLDAFKKWYVVNAKKYDPEKMCVTTLKFLGTEAEVKRQEQAVYGIAKKYGGMAGGEENGARGYFLTFMIAYIRDFGMNYHFIAESFETSVPWEHVSALCSRVKQRIADSCQKNDVPLDPFVSCRVTQLYDAGVCVYFYFGFSAKGMENPVLGFSCVEADARDEVLRCGGSLSHHHGVGKIRKEWVDREVGDVGVRMIKALKKELDPTNVLAAGNLVDMDPEHPINIDAISGRKTC